MKRDKTRGMEFGHLRVANPIELENLNRCVTRPDIYPLVPASHSVPWNTYVRSPKVSPRTRYNSSSTEALGSDQARQTARWILQHTRSLPTRSPEPQIQIVGRKSTSDSDLSKRNTTRTPRVSGRDRSSYRSDYMTEYEDYAAVGNRTPATSSMIQRPKIKLVKPKKSRESERSYPIIGESAGMYTDMTDTMLKVLDRRAAIAAQARELENTLAEEAYALEQNRQRVTGYVPGSVARHSLSSQPFYMNTVTGTTSMGIPLAEYTPVPQMRSMLYASTPTSHVRDILPPLAPEQDRVVEYVEEQRRYMKSVLPTSSNDRSGVSSGLAREIQEFCSLWDDYRPDERETHHVRLESMKEQKEKQKKLAKRESDEVFEQMTRNVEKERVTTGDCLNSGTSTISDEERHMAFTVTDFRYLKEKINKTKQKVEELYMNWQAEYEEARTTEESVDIHRFYEPQVQKYEKKYNMLCQVWKRALCKRKRISSSKGSTPELTPNVTAVGDTFTLKDKEGNRDKSRVETPHRYSTREGRLTPRAPTCEDMRTVTPYHGSSVETQEYLLATEKGEDIEKVTQQPLDPIEKSESRDVPPISEEYRPDEIKERVHQENMSRQNEIPRESRREGALTTTRDFFNSVTERRSATEVPAITMTGVSQLDTPPTTSAPETEHLESSPVRTFPLSEIPPRPTATATLGPKTWVQRVSEGQIEGQFEDAEEDDTLEPFVMEDQPDELRPERRILYPFEIPGVKNPTEDIPPAQRGLVENDTQTDEYLEDAPSWEQEKCYPSRYGDPFDRDHGIGRGQGRFSSRGHKKNDCDRNDFPPSVGRDIRLKLPPGQARFTDWSNISTPPAVFSNGLPDKSTELDENIPNQVNGPAAEITRSEGIDVSNVDKATMAFQSELVREDPDMCAGPTIPIDTGPQNNNLEQNEENVDIIPPVPISKARLSLHTDEAVIVDTSQESSVGNDVPGSNKVRSLTMASLSSNQPVESHIMSGEKQMVVVNRGRDPPRTSIMNRRNSSDGNDDERSRRDRGRPPERDRVGPFDRGRPPDRRGYPERGGPLDRGGPFDKGRPPDRGRPPDKGGPLDRGRPPDERTPRGIPSDGGSSSETGGTLIYTNSER